MRSHFPIIRPSLRTARHLNGLGFWPRAVVAKHRATLVENIVQELNEWHFDVFAGVVVASDRHMWSTLLLEDVNLPLGGPRKVSECAL